MFRHVVMFRWGDAADDTARRDVLEGLRALPEQVPGVRSFQLGPDAGISDGNFDLVVVADFDDADAYRSYAAHPAHVQLVRDVIRPVISERAAVQHEL